MTMINIMSITKLNIYILKYMPFCFVLIFNKILFLYNKKIKSKKKKKNNIKNYN